MIVFTATLFLIIAAVVALAGVAASSGSTHWAMTSCYRVIT